MLRAAQETTGKAGATQPVLCVSAPPRFQKNSTRKHSQLVRLPKIVYNCCMSTAELRREIKQLIDKLPPDRLESLAGFIETMNRPLTRRIKQAERSIAKGKGTAWRKVRKDV